MIPGQVSDVPRAVPGADDLRFQILKTSGEQCSIADCRLPIVEEDTIASSDQSSISNRKPVLSPPRQANAPAIERLPLSTVCPVNLLISSHEGSSACEKAV